MNTQQWFPYLELLSCQLPNAMCTRLVIDLTINLFKSLKMFLQSFQLNDNSSHQANQTAIKFFERKIPDFGRLLNDFISYLDNMPDEVSENHKYLFVFLINIARRTNH